MWKNMEEWVKENIEFDIEICNWNPMLLNFPGASSNSFISCVIHGGFKGWQEGNCAGKGDKVHREPSCTSEERGSLDNFWHFLD